jgi:carboxylesterase type B
MWISIQYRLQAYGFLSSSEVRDDGIANAGLLDQRAALEWLQRHAAALGADPKRVTIWGNSAGGGSVANQMILYGGEQDPPFSQAIPEYPWWQSYHNESTLEAQYQGLLDTTSCTSLTCLRSLPADVLANATQATIEAAYIPGSTASLYGFGDFYFGPTVDGNIIRQLPSQEFLQGHFTPVPMLVDRDEYEGVYFSNQTETTIAEETTDILTIFPAASDAFVTRLYQLYPPSDFNSTFFQRQSIYGDFIINCPTYYMATALSAVGVPVYKLRFAAGTELHAATQPFLLDVPPADSNNRTLGLLLRDYFISFAVEGDPNAVSYSGTVKPEWPLYFSDGGFNVLDVNYTMIGAIPDYDAGPRCDFFHGQSYIVRN